LAEREALEREIKRRFPDDYHYMLETLYPRLRAVSFKYDLRRVGMVKDTIHTTVPDTLYARGVSLLKGRRYNDALKVLGGFRDRNAAICMLSLGLDEGAYPVLKALPEHSTHSYLLAIVCARLGREDEALAHFDRAVELNENIRWRGRLDPEISTLIENRKDGTEE
jgi:tetratricopeptide (TPR) repeat protein